MRLKMKTRKEITKEAAKRYRKASKADKGRILDEFCATTGYNRSYAARMLGKRQSGAGGKARAAKRPPGARGQGGKPVYTEEVMAPLVKIWAILNFPCGKRLVANLAEIVRVLEGFGEVTLSPQVKEKLLSMSAATADRLLASERKKTELRSRSKAKPGSLLKHRVPIRTFADRDDVRPGFLEIDPVGHDGGSARGDCCRSLDGVDVASGWIELRAVKNKAQRWVFEAIEDMRGTLPFPLLGIDSDTGAEFSNAHLIEYCKRERITFTRSRPCRKNDNCYVEQKNYTAVRQYVGYFRYDTDERLLLLSRLHEALCPYLNLFQPQAKPMEKAREGSRVRKRYDEPNTPYRRLLESPEIDELTKRKLRRQYAKLNPARLMREINSLQGKLFEMVGYGVVDHAKEAGQEGICFEQIFL